MTSHALNQLEADQAQPLQLRDILPGPGWAPVRSATAPNQEPHAGPRGQLKPRLLSALATACMEIAIPIGVVAIWQLWMHQR